MRPQESKRTARAAAERQARLLLKAELWWLPGFPSQHPEGALTWTVLGTPGHVGEQVELTPRHLSRATTALRKLTGEFPEALPRIVPEPKRWAASVEALLDALKPTLHRRSPIPSPLGVIAASQPRRIQRRVETALNDHPYAEAIIQALAWRSVAHGKLLVHLLDCAEGLPLMKLAAVDPMLPVKVVELASRAGTRPAKVLIRLIHDVLERDEPPLSDGYAARLAKGFGRLAKDEQAAKPLPRRPDSGGPAALLRFVQWLFEQDEDVQTRALDLLARLDPSGFLERWETWWKRVGRCANQGDEVRHLGRRERRDAYGALRRKAEALGRKQPPPISFRNLFYLIRWWASTTDAPIAELVAVLDKVGDGFPRLALALHWHNITTHESCAVARIGLSGLGRFFAATEGMNDAHRFHLWRGLEEGFNRGAIPTWTVEQQLLSDIPEQAAAFYDAAAECARTTACWPEPAQARLLVELLKQGCPLGPAVVLARRQLGDDVPSFVARLARFAQFDLPVTEAVLARLRRTDEDRDSILAGLELLASVSSREVAIGLLFDGAVRRVARCGEVADVLRGKITLVPLAADDRWIDDYPPELRPWLHALAEASDSARQTAHRLLRQHYPKAKEIRREVDVLRRKAAVGDQGAAKRLARLEKRIGEAPRVGQGRMVRLQERLRRARRLALLERFEQHVTRHVEDAFGGVPGDSDIRKLLDSPRWRRVLIPILGLSPATRSLAVRLVAIRQGPPPWDLRDEPANAAFLRRLVKRGVDVEPWAEGSVATTVECLGQRITLALENDPLDVFEMGHHFDTCLSPGSCNYFSVFANAADINKRVLYARTADGRVVGRCLLALTDTGGIVAFHPYAHRSELGFETLVREFGAKLAEKMGVHMLPHGSVSRLVATDWYDDGPRDLGGSFDLLKERSAFRAELASTPPEELIAKLESGFSPVPLNELTLPLVLELDEVTQHPGRLRVLLREAAKLPELPPHAVCRAVKLATENGETDLARSAWCKRLESMARDWWCRERYFHPTLVGLLVTLDPSVALRVVRFTRRRNARKGQDHDPRRLEVAADAHAALRRPRQAAELYRLAAKHAADSGWRRRLNERATTLQDQL